MLSGSKFKGKLKQKIIDSSDINLTPLQQVCSGVRRRLLRCQRVLRDPLRPGGRRCDSFAPLLQLLIKGPTSQQGKEAERQQVVSHRLSGKSPASFTPDGSYCYYACHWYFCFKFIKTSHFQQFEEGGETPGIKTKIFHALGLNS